MKQQVGLYMMPPPRRMKWSHLHYFLMLMIVVHFGLMVFLGIFSPNIFKKEPQTYVVNVIKDVKQQKKKKPGTKKTAPKPKPKREVKKTQPRKKVKKKTRPAKKLKLDLPRSSYPTVDPNAYPRAEKIPQKSSDEGKPSGEEDGIVGSNGSGGDETGEGGSGRYSGGYSSSAGDPQERPWVFWGYNNPIELSDSKRETLANYAKLENVNPILIDPTVPNYRKLIGLGKGEVKFKIEIPGASEIPVTGVHPLQIEILSVKAEQSGMEDKMKEIAQWCVESSGWYPAKEDGEPVTSELEFSLHFYGSYKYTE